MTIAIIEIFDLAIKDSITQRKLNQLINVQKAKDGTLFEASQYELGSFFKKARRDFFVSGITLRQFCEEYETEVYRMLERNVKVSVLILSPEQLVEHTKMYFGIDKNDDDWNREIG